MARNYAVDFDNISTTTPPKTIVGLETAGTNFQAEIYEIQIGSRATPASQAQTYVVGRTTADGATGSTPTPAPLNPDSVAALATARTAPGTEPTYASTFLWHLSLNQQASWRWVTQPGQGTGLYSAHGAATDGIALKCTAVTTAFAVDGHIHFQE